MLPSKRLKFNSKLIFLGEQGQQIIQELNEDGIPREFIDPIMYGIMEDPVTLPQQGDHAEPINIDRHVLEEHFKKNGRHDPFTKMALTPDHIKDNIELHQRILEWKEKNLEKIEKFRVGKPQTAKSNPKEQAFAELLDKCIRKFTSHSYLPKYQNNILNSLKYIEFKREFPFWSIRFRHFHVAFDAAIYIEVEKIEMNLKGLFKRRDKDLEPLISMYRMYKDLYASYRHYVN